MSPPRRRAVQKKSTENRAKAKAVASTPVRGVLKSDSALLASVVDGLGAVVNAELSCIDAAIRGLFGDSLNLDEATRVGRENENRWDYLLGHTPTGQVVAVEPHSAREDQISTIISKKEAAVRHIRDEVKNGAGVSRWLWVASGNVQFSQMDKAMRRLDQAGIQFAGTRLLARHLPK